MRVSVPLWHLFRIGILALFVPAAAQAQHTERVSLDSAGVEGGGFSECPSLSADGRYVAFMSSAPDLVPGDTNAAWDIFVHDRLTGQTIRASVDSAGVEGNGGSWFPAISADGRYVAFESEATNLVSGDTNHWLDVFVHDCQSGTTIRVSVDSAGLEGNQESRSASLSGDGRYVAFASAASNLAPADTDQARDVFVHDRLTGQTTLESLDITGFSGYGEAPSISADGRWLAFQSSGWYVVPGDTNYFTDVFLRDRQAGTTSRVSVDSAGTQGNDDSTAPSISADGRFVAFQSEAWNLVPGDSNIREDVFVHDAQTGVTTRVSVNSSGLQASYGARAGRISADGACVAFESNSNNLVPGDSNSHWDVFLHDRSSAKTSRASLNSSAVQGNGESLHAAISADGRFVAFDSLATNLAGNDTNSAPDVFVHDRIASGFVELCLPGQTGVIGCPCANPPANTGRGCDNSSGTGGARLAASGFAYLSTDSLVFSTSDEGLGATSVLVQGDALVPSGIAFGQGVRCAGGALRRLYLASATSGGIQVPDVQAGDPPVSVRSAQLGFSIQPGQPCVYFVYYRDPSVLGGCPPLGTFNCTQGGTISWWP